MVSITNKSLGLASEIMLGDDERNLAILSEENELKIRESHFSLVSTVAKKLEQMNIDFIEFQRFAVQHYSKVTDLNNDSSIGDILVNLSKAVASNSYYSCGIIEFVCDKYGEGDQDLAKLIEDYQNELAGYHATTRIIKCMRKESDYDEAMYEMESDKTLQESMEAYDTSYCHTLRVKLRAQVSQKCLDYIEKLWKSITKYLYLPKLPAILISICKGCIEVAWLVPAVVAREIQQKAENFDKVAQEFPLMSVKLDGHILYPKANLVRMWPFRVY